MGGFPKNLVETVKKSSKSKWFHGKTCKTVNTGLPTFTNFMQFHEKEIENCDNNFYGLENYSESWFHVKIWVAEKF